MCSTLITLPQVSVECFYSLQMVYKLVFSYNYYVIYVHTYHILVPRLASAATLGCARARGAGLSRTARSLLYADLGLDAKDHEHVIGMGRVDMEQGHDSG